MKVGRAPGTKNRTQAECHSDRKHYCKGLCRACYSKLKRKRDKDNGTVRSYPETKRICALRPLGWTVELFDTTKEAQNNRCAICRKILNMDKKQNGARACADHKHSIPPQPRGILCTNCNAMIGQAQENPQILREAANYLEKFSLEYPTEEVKTNSIRENVQWTRRGKE